MLVHHINCGTMCPPAARFATGHGELVCHCLLIERDSGLVLVDTGLGTNDVTNPARFGLLTNAVLRPRYRLDETAVEQVRARGFDRADVTDIVLTHLHLDHAGGLSDFPRARVHLHAAEVYAATESPTARERTGYFADQWSHAPRWETYSEDGDVWFGFEGVQPLRGVDDIALVPLFGHTRGHTGVAIRDGDRWLLHAGDAYFHRATLTDDAARPLGLKLFERFDAFDPRRRDRNALRLRELHAGAQVDIFCSHDPAELAAHRAEPES
jgi:glyoxylase-like metal-dependent hydrolase (beta-lactamase superfamily II)